MARLISSIYAMGEPERISEAEQERRRQEARRQIWKRHGLAVFDPAEITDDWLRQAIRNEAEKQFGRGK